MTNETKLSPKAGIYWALMAGVRRYQPLGVNLGIKPTALAVYRRNIRRRMSR